MPDSTITSNIALLATDRHGSVLRQHAVQASPPTPYTAFGFRPIANELPSVLGFNGQLQDLKTGMYLLGNGYRVYSPMLMRFLSPDSLSPFGEGGPNAYVYCSGDPVNAVDPSGHTRTYKIKIKIKIDRTSGPVPGGEYVPSRQQASNRTGDTVSLVHEAQSYEATSHVENLYVFESGDGKPIYVLAFHVKEMQEIAGRWEAIAREGTDSEGALDALTSRTKEIAKMGASLYKQAADRENRNVNFVQDNNPLVRES
ncbi:RHS repeat-associated core domain-containing protein [Pseudomonas sp. NMI760_13]|jgi:RHS repeat-associated protein|uniref:RHS repeat-associated core domain-containing protein n=1 Tax=Pseudomonas sp. NMI760_13 TaxID=2903147 RepID=UPI001E537F99|nr:RHS repeat-associated core domain-containing protein [Pseudomonas sp. NMI760_13]MCE0915689.1 RHS repeat-associated core domain-containing protein [Pseudomonas sp. NMI760_13]MDC0687561.1 RHS repeat-associated core domain-containing protein [Mitsuaria sp. RG]